MINSRAVAEPMLLLKNATLKAASLEKIEDAANFIEKIKQNFKNADFEHAEKRVSENNLSGKSPEFDQDKQNKVKLAETNNETAIWNKLINRFEKGSTKSVLTNHFSLKMKNGEWYLIHKGERFSMERIKKEFDNINKLFYEITSSSINSIIEDDEEGEKLKIDEHRMENKDQAENNRAVDLLKKRYNATIIGSQDVKHA